MVRAEFSRTCSASMRAGVRGWNALALSVLAAAATAVIIADPRRFGATRPAVPLEKKVHG
jgi:hypothetical protein